MRDKVEKGRQAVLAGDQNPNVKLSDRDVERVRKIVTAGETHRAAAARFGVSRSLVTSIINGRIRKAAA